MCEEIPNKRLRLDVGVDKDVPITLQVNAEDMLSYFEFDDREGFQILAEHLVDFRERGYKNATLKFAPNFLEEPLNKLKPKNAVEFSLNHTMFESFLKERIIPYTLDHGLLEGDMVESSDDEREINFTQLASFFANPLKFMAVTVPEKLEGKTLDFLGGVKEFAELLEEMAIDRFFEQLEDYIEIPEEIDAGIYNDLFCYYQDNKKWEQLAGLIKRVYDYSQEESGEWLSDEDKKTIDEEGLGKGDSEEEEEKD